MLFGANAVFAKLSYDDGVAVFALLWMRYLLPLVVLGPLAVGQRRRDPAPLPFRHALLVAAPYLGSSAAYLASLKLGPVNQIAPFFYLYPAILAVIGRVFFGERLARQMVFAIVLGVLGSALLVGFDGGEHRLPGGEAARATLGDDGGPVLHRELEARARAPVDPGGRGDLPRRAGIGFAPVVVLTGAGLGLPDALPYVLAIAIGGSAIGLLLLQVGMRRLGATQASLLSLVEPIVTLLLAFVVLDEATQAAPARRDAARARLVPARAGREGPESHAGRRHRLTYVLDNPPLAPCANVQFVPRGGPGNVAPDERRIARGDGRPHARAGPRVRPRHVHRERRPHQLAGAGRRRL